MQSTIPDALKAAKEINDPTWQWVAYALIAVTVLVIIILGAVAFLFKKMKEKGDGEIGGAGNFSDKTPAWWAAINSRFDKLEIGQQHLLDALNGHIADFKDHGRQDEERFADMHEKINGVNLTVANLSGKFESSRAGSRPAFNTGTGKG